jgi:hypothetical protein
MTTNYGPDPSWVQPVDIHNSMQNAFVQSWLEAYMTEIPTDQDDYDKFESVIEGIQETYNYKDHEARKKSVATGGELDTCLHVLGRFMTILPEETDLYQHLNMAYAVVNATKQIAKES